MRSGRAHLSIATSALAGAVVAILSAGTSACTGAAMPTSVSAPSSYDIAATEQWRAARETSLKAPDGWLSVAGLFFLKPGVNTVGSDPTSDIALPAGAAPAHAGRIRVDGQHAILDLEPDVRATATINGQPMKDRDNVELRAASDSSDRPADLVRIGRLTLLRHRSGDREAIRLRDPESPIRRDFTTLNWFPIDPAWNVTGTFTKFKEPRPLQIANVLGDIDQESSPGEATVTIDGNTVTLLPLIDNGRLWFVFSDTLGGTETYRIRFVKADMPTGDRVTIDFNRTYNPPCAYNPYTTCPLPPPQNRLRFAVRAGERAYGPHPTTASASKTADVIR